VISRRARGHLGVGEQLLDGCPRLLVPVEVGALSELVRRAHEGGGMELGYVGRSLIVAEEVAANDVTCFNCAKRRETARNGGSHVTNASWPPGRKTASSTR
jgi:hypothetical protein